MKNNELALLLSEGLDLCVRAKNLDEQTEKAFLDAQKSHLAGETRCITPALWIQDQYDNDLTAWETKARNALIKGGYMN